MFLEKMSYLEVEEYLNDNDTVIIVTGSTENHGKHMPLGTDTMIPQKIAELVDERVGRDVVIAPVLPYGSTEDLMGFAGTISVGPDLLTQILNKICGQLFDYGFRHFIILNGHGGNSKSIENTAHFVYKLGGRLARIDWWLVAGQINPDWKGGHGGGEETAGVMAVNEELIKWEYINEGENRRNDLGDELPSSVNWNSVMFKGGLITIPRPIEDITDNGWFAYGMEDAPSRANAKWGTEMVNGMAEYIADFIPVFSRVKMPDKK